MDNGVLDEFRARADKAGIGEQTMMNDALRQITVRSRPASDGEDFAPSLAPRDTRVFARFNRRTHGKARQERRAPVMGI
ncbi:MAG: hypothetical protein ACREBC_14000 [Pyrinomonadaceae bacterium]